MAEKARVVWTMSLEVLRDRCRPGSMPLDVCRDGAQQQRFHGRVSYILFMSVRKQEWMACVIVWFGEQSVEGLQRQVQAGLDAVGGLQRGQRKRKSSPKVWLHSGQGSEGHGGTGSALPTSFFGQ